MGEQVNQAPSSARGSATKASTPAGEAARSLGTVQLEAPAAQEPRYLSAQPPYYSGDPALLARVAKAPLPDLEGLVSTLVPGAELATDGVLEQFADEELVMFAYALEQIELATNNQIM